MTDSIPLGLSFSYLKGSMEWMQDLLAEEQRDKMISPQTIRHARVQLAEALDKYRNALTGDAQTSPIVTGILEPIDKSLVRDSHTMLQMASSLLSTVALRQFFKWPKI